MVEVGEHPMVMEDLGQVGAEEDPMEAGVNLEGFPDLEDLEVHFLTVVDQVLEVPGWDSTIFKVDLKGSKEVQVQVVGAMEVTWEEEEEVRNQEYLEKMKDLQVKKEVMVRPIAVVRVRTI